MSLDLRELLLGSGGLGAALSRRAGEILDDAGGAPDAGLLREALRSLARRPLGAQPGNLKRARVVLVALDRLGPGVVRDDADRRDALVLASAAGRSVAGLPDLLLARVVDNLGRGATLAVLRERLDELAAGPPHLVFLEETLLVCALTRDEPTIARAAAELGRAASEPRARAALWAAAASPAQRARLVGGERPAPPTSFEPGLGRWRRVVDLACGVLAAGPPGLARLVDRWAALSAQPLVKTVEITSGEYAGYDHPTTTAAGAEIGALAAVLAGILACAPGAEREALEAAAGERAVTLLFAGADREIEPERLPAAAALARLLAADPEVEELAR